MMTRMTSLLLLAAAFPLVAQETPKTPKVRFERDVTYAKVGELEMKLDLALPEGNGPFPCVLCVHGGGWRGGKRQDMYLVTKLLAERGFAAVTMSYRLTPQHTFPAQIEDCKAAVRWLRVHAAKYRINPDRFGAIGLSAGGHLVSLLGAADASAGLEGPGAGMESTRVQAVVSFFGPTDFTAKIWTKEVEDHFLVPFLGGSYEEKASLYRKCSPLIYVSKDDPPFLFFHGDKDTLVGIEHSEKMTKKLREAGVQAELVTMTGEGHGWIGERLTKTLEHTVRFFNEHLKK